MTEGEEDCRDKTTDVLHDIPGKEWLYHFLYTVFHLNALGLVSTDIPLRGNVQKKKSLFKDIIQIMVDHPPSYPIFDKLFFDKNIAKKTAFYNF